MTQDHNENVNSNTLPRSGASSHRSYTPEHLETSRQEKLPPLDVFRAVLGALLKLSGTTVQLLDCGCGTGFFTRQYALLPGVSATGMDLDENLLSAARESARKDKLNIRFMQGDIISLPYPDHSFDVVTSDILLEIFPDKTVPVGEMTRVCRPGGKVLCIEPNYRSTVYYDPRLSPEDNRLWCNYHRLGRGFGAGVELPEAMRRVGLTDIQIIPWLWGGLELSRPNLEDTFLAEQNAGLQRGLSLGIFTDSEAKPYQALFQRTADAHQTGEALVLSGIDLYLVCGQKPAAQ